MYNSDNEIENYRIVEGYKRGQRKRDGKGKSGKGKPERGKSGGGKSEGGKSRGGKSGGGKSGKGKGERGNRPKPMGRGMPVNNSIDIIPIDNSYDVISDFRCISKPMPIEKCENDCFIKTTIFDCKDLCDKDGNCKGFTYENSNCILRKNTDCELLNRKQSSIYYKKKS